MQQAPKVDHSDREKFTLVPYSLHCLKQVTIGIPLCQIIFGCISHGLLIENWRQTMLSHFLEHFRQSTFAHNRHRSSQVIEFSVLCWPGVSHCIQLSSWTANCTCADTMVEMHN